LAIWTVLETARRREVNQASSRKTGTGSGPRTGGGLLAGLLLVAIVVVAGIGWLSVTGRLAGLQYTNIPIVHPYPPSGEFVNPFTGDPRDLVSSAEAAKVKSDLLHDGDLQLAALAQGSTAVLPQTATGNYLAKLNETVAADNAQGVVYREQHRLDSVTVGRLPDPNAPTTISWAVEERGSGEAAYVTKSSGKTVSSYHGHFRNRFWLARVGDRYLIADAQISFTRES
jgi:hypothetical protein